MRYGLVKDGAILEEREYEPGQVGDQSSLHPSKPRLLPIVVIDPPYDATVQVRSGPAKIIEGTQIREVYTVRDFSNEEIEQLRAKRVVQIKSEAQRRIYEVMLAHQQINWLALAMELTITYGPDTQGWPEEHRNAVAVVLPQWQQIKAIRTRSNEIEADLSALATAREVYDFNPLLGWDD